MNHQSSRNTLIPGLLSLLLLAGFNWVPSALDPDALAASVYLDAKDPWPGAYLIVDKGGDRNPGLYSLWFQLSTSPVYRDDKLPGRDTKRDTVTVSLAANESESFQIVFYPCLEEPGVEVVLSDLVGPGGGTIPANCLEWNPVEYVHLFGRRPRDFWWPEGKSARLGLVPDVLGKPIPFTANGLMNNPIWITIASPENARPGIYRGVIKLKGSRYLDEEIPLKVRIYDFRLPEFPSLQSMLDYSASILSAGKEQYYYGDIHDMPHGNFLVKVRDKRPTAEYVKDYFALFRKYRVTIEYLYPREPEVIISGDKIEVKFDEWARQVADQVKARGPVPFTIPNFISDTWGWNFRWNWHGIDPASERFARLFTDYCRQVGAGLKRWGWIDRCYLHLWNEIRPEDHPRLVRICRLIRKGDPDLLIFTSTEIASSLLPEAAELDKYVNLWKGSIANAGSDWYKEKRARGVKVQTNYTTALGRPPLFSHHFTWRCKQVGSNLFRDWAVANWIHDSWVIDRQFGIGPWPTPNRKVEAYYPQFPADGMYIYPPPDGRGKPLASIRLAVLRDAIDDYDYLTILEQRWDEAAAKIGVPSWRGTGKDRVQEYCESFVPTGKPGVFDVAAHDTLRKKLAAEIEALTRHPLILVKTNPPEGRVQPYLKDIRVEGIVEKGTIVKINGKRVKVRGKRFKTVVRSIVPGYHPRYRPIEITATKDGMKKVITRKFESLRRQPLPGS